MKKRLLSALLALALVFVLLPTTALAGETTGKDYDISINGKGYKFDSDGSNGYITAYYYGNSPSKYFFSTKADDNWTTNSNLMLTKKGNTVTITIRSSKYSPSYESPQFTLKKESTEINDVPCIEMGNDNNLVITGKGTLNITRNENKSYGAALYSNVGDITINGGITVNVSFLNGKDYYNKNVSSNAIYVGDNHNLTVSGSGTNVIATNQGFHSSPATVCVEGGTITVSGGASLSATNTYDDNRSGSDDVKIQHFNSYAISGTKSNPCTLIVADEKSSVTATTNDFTNIAESWAFKYTTIQAAGATIKAGSSVSNSTVTTIDNISGQRYAKISIPALETTADVLIAKENAVVGVRTSLGEGNGYYTYNKDTKTLTLEDVSITNVAHFIQFWAKDSYTIELKGTNTITGVTSAIRVPEKGYNNESLDGLNVTITGTGSLNVIANTYAIDMQVGNLIFNNTGNITLTTNTNYKVPSTVCNALRVKSGSITIDNTKYDIVGARQEKNYPTETISDSSAFTPDLLNGYTVGEETTLFKTITITPAAAKDSTISYDGKTLKQGETIKDENDGTATVDRKNNTITLNNFKGDKALVFNAEFTPNSITLIGDSTLSAVETKYQNLTISGSGSLTVGSIKVHNQKTSSDDKPNLTINGATVTVGTAELTTRAIDIDGDLTVTNGSLTATSKSDSVPTVQVGGNASFTGSTVTITNHSTTQGEQYEDSNAASSALHVNGAVTISGGTVMAEAKAGGNAIRAVKDITVSDGAQVTATNNSQHFSAITAGKASDGVVNNLSKLIVSGENTRITATNTHDNNLTYGGAINAYIKNANEGHYLKVGTDTKAIAPNAKTTVRNNSLTITRGDAYETPQVAANYTIAGQTMYVGKYYKTDADDNITDGTAQDYNIYCDSENDFTLNNATISSTGTGGSTGVIKTNLNYSSAQFHIKLIGTNSINNTGHHAILGNGSNSTIIIENAENASNASLTISGNYLPVYSYGNVTINAEVVIKNTNGNLISTIKGGHANGAFDLGSGYKCYASTSTTGNPLEEFNSANYGAYKYLRVTTQTPETGGGSTHEHVWDEAWHDTGDYHHAHQCTICKAYDTTTQESHNVTGHRDNHDGSHSNICGSCGYSAKVSHSYTWAPNANDNEKHIGTCVCGNVVERYHNFVGDVCSDCGYDKSTGTTCEHVWTTEWTIDTVDNEYHWHKCIKCNAITDKKPHAYTIVTDSGTNHIRECECKVFYVEDHISSDWIIDAPATPTTAGSMHKECTVCKHKMQTEVIPATGEIVPPTPHNPGTNVINRPTEEEKPAQQPNPSTGANDLVGLAVAAAVAAALGSAALLRKHD